MSPPIRTCIVCRTRMDKGRLVRVVARQGLAQVDSAGRLPGRGAYVCSPECAKRVLVPQGILARALRKKVAGEPAALVQAVEEALAARVAASRLVGGLG